MTGRLQCDVDNPSTYHWMQHYPCFSFSLHVNLPAFLSPHPLPPSDMPIDGGKNKKKQLDEFFSGLLFHHRDTAVSIASISASLSTSQSASRPHLFLNILYWKSNRFRQVCLPPSWWSSSYTFVCLYMRACRLREQSMNRRALSGWSPAMSTVPISRPSKQMCSHLSAYWD